MISIALPIRQKLFAYFDKMKIGLVNYKTFLSVLDPQKLGPTKDNWNWQNQTLKRIVEWMERENLQISDAFKIIDTDFDGIISKNDISLFCQRVLLMKKHELTTMKLARLFKLLDCHNRRNIQLIDFE